MPEERYIRTGDEQWTQHAEFAVRWEISKKGNPYLKIGVLGEDVVLSVFRSQFKRTDEWTYSVLYRGSWMPSQRFFVDEDSAKAAALQEVGRMRRAGTNAPEPERPKREPVREEPTGRRIKL